MLLECTTNSTTIYQVLQKMQFFKTLKLYKTLPQKGHIYLILSNKHSYWKRTINVALFHKKK